jgi:branched-chain amino acid transport system ATP-binding protein
VTRTLLETTGLTMRFGGVAALDGVDFSICDRELRCLIGPNGAGKSTLFKCLTGQYRPSAGVVRFEGRTLAGVPSYQIARRGVGIKMQVPSVFENLSVRENVWLGSSRIFPRNVAGRRAEESLERLGIGHLGDTTLNRLAHGQRQLVELAMVLVGDPKLILLDEPAAGMTDTEVERLVVLIKELNRDHALLIVEHDMQFVRQVATRVTVLHRGRVLMDGQVDQILANDLVRDVYLGKEAVQ